ncbi:succinyl-diaminopimelate desuccinylase [Oceanibaculum pacificum]|uniref:Succinyl-diaminopimelate desuccinylase n=1 Tax=Oceanibaculum pacificum TaxID=580166 RepID=A0A154VYI2_9PROT|nr:succinyl-diaminopimelate desuccinylase [Oceanibaculum pacificum]KZD06279.1 succinyl-diaminopimelate desuccinylase [Oceanibaculum pacificum]
MALQDPTPGALDPVALAQALIRCPSVTPADEGALDVLGRALEGIGFTCQRLRFEAEGTPPVDNLYARIGTEGPVFCYAGHTDVVPVGDAAAWSIDPFAAEIHDGVLYGRGAVDMKSSIASFAAAAQAFIAKRDSLPGSIVLLITGDEEGPAINGTKKVLDWMAARGETIDACVVGEPTNPTKLGEMVKIGRRGSLTGRLTVYGAQGHVAYPHLADNPIHRLVRMLAPLSKTYIDEGSDYFQPSSVQVTTIDVGNLANNVVPAQAKAVFNIRFNDLWTSAKLEAWLRQAFDEGLGTDGGRYELACSTSGESFLTEPGWFSDLLQDAVEKVTGRRPELSTTGGTSDARFIRAVAPVAEFGLVGQTMHKVDERVAVEDIRKLAEIYETVLTAFFARNSART